MRYFFQNLVGKLKGRDSLGDIGADGRIIYNFRNKIQREIHNVFFYGAPFSNFQLFEIKLSIT
jgi:hypothetical protein